MGLINVTSYRSENNGKENGMPSSPELLKSIELFSSFTQEELEKVAPLVNPMKVMEGEILAKKGARSRTFFIVIKGNFMISFENGKAITLHNKGDIMGWSTLVAPFTYKGTVIALTNGEVLTLPGQEFYLLLQSESALSSKIMNEINSIIASREPYHEA
jgi:CRP-like cAMP-binding protein